MNLGAMKHLENIPWTAHPTAPGVEMKKLVTKAADGPDVSCLLIRIPLGSVVPEHIHETQEDIVFPLSGRGSMRVGQEEFELKPGMIVRIPANTKHGIYQVEEELLVYDVFSPALL